MTSAQNRRFKDKEDSTKRNEKIVRLIRDQVVLISNRYTCIKTNTHKILTRSMTIRRVISSGIQYSALSSYTKTQFFRLIE